MNSLPPTSPNPIRELLEFQSGLLKKLQTLLTDRHQDFRARVSPDGKIEPIEETTQISSGPDR